jgi:hypothetical protein
MKHLEGIAALVLAGSIVLGSLAASAQTGGATTGAVSSSETATPVTAPSPGRATSSTVVIQTSGPGVGPQEPVPMADTIDNRANNPPASSANSSSKP